MLAVLLVTTAVIGGTLAAGLTAFCKRRTRRRNNSSEAHPLDFGAPFLFERPSRWLAVKCSNLNKVQAALKLHNPTPCPLSEGFSRLAERKLFISPPIKGWVLVVGNSLPDPVEDIDKLYHFLMRVADQVGSVQY